MACTIELADLGPDFTEVDEDLFAMWLEGATAIVLGVAAGRDAVQARLVACGIDACAAITAVTQHLIASTPGSGAEAKFVTASRVGAIARNYAAQGASSPLWRGSPYGIPAAIWMHRIERCLKARKTVGGLFSTSGGCCS